LTAAALNATGITNIESSAQAAEAFPSADTVEFDLACLLKRIKKEDALRLALLYGWELVCIAEEIFKLRK
jgi:hypothetical protein